MEIGLPILRKSILAGATVGEDGALHLKNANHLALKPGETVALTISPIEPRNNSAENPLLGTVMRYDDPFGPATVQDDWAALSDC